MNEQSFMKALFHGVVAEDLVFPYPHIAPEERERTTALLDNVRKFFTASVDSARIDDEACISAQVMAGLKALGLFGLRIPRELGGLGLGTPSYARVLQEIAGRDASIAVTLGAHQGIGLKGIELFGSDELKRRYLPRLARGEWTAAFALTEPSAGSDASAIKTRAELSTDGTHYVLRGSKLWITNGGFADVFTVFARTSPPGEGNKPRLTAFVVERSMGLTSGPNADKLGIRGASTTEVVMNEVAVPVENVLGEVGKGFKVAMEVLNHGRLGLAAGCVGMSRALVRLVIERVQERRAFGRNIGEFGLVKDKVADMLARTFAIESMTHLTAHILDMPGADFSLESAICKVAASETLWAIADDAMHIAAGIGYMTDSPYPRMLRDARVNLVFEGTNDILRCFIALSGMQSPGNELSDVVKAMREPIKGFGLLGDFALRKARSAFGRERVSRAHALLRRETVIFEEYTAELASQTEVVLRKHGREIAEMQFTQRRIADMAIDLFGIAACLARTTDAIERRGEEGARRELDMTTLFVNGARRRLRQIMSDFQRNDDELRKTVASRAYVDGAYPFDVL